ncbi:MAG: hypothetical protein DMG59_13955 [Acidobacteria bacterium]|nr:MAG: hypothetical protein DMG59_13955 [Acidobacteriota bacterium]
MRNLNFAAVPKGPLGYLTAWPTGKSQPLAASLTAPTGTVTANAVIVPAGTNGSVDIYSTDNTDLVIDITGYFALPGPADFRFTICLHAGCWTHGSQRVRPLSAVRAM